MTGICEDKYMTHHMLQYNDGIDRDEAELAVDKSKHRIAINKGCASE